MIEIISMFDFEGSVPLFRVLTFQISRLLESDLCQKLNCL